MTRCGLGQDSHRFLPQETNKPCVIGGLVFDDVPGFQANSDGDVIFHAICNAISSISGVIILGGIADDLCLKDGITDSQVYLEKALETLGSQQITHVALSLEGRRPHFKPRLDELRTHIASVMGLTKEQIGITATTGEGLNDVGCGEGIQCLALLTVE